MSRLTTNNKDNPILKDVGHANCKNICEHETFCDTCSIQEAIDKLAHYKDLEEQGRLIEREYATIVGESGICSECGESYMDVADADAFQSGYIPNFCPWCGAIFVSEAKLAELNNRDAINTEVNYSDAINVYRELNTHDREKSVSELAELKEQI